MVRDPLDVDEPPSPGAVSAALDDPDCRRIIEALEEPRTAAEIRDSCEIPQSTLYRKLELLTEATLLEEMTEIRRDGHHASKYAVAFEEITFSLDEGHVLTVAVDRPPLAADERLAALWSEIRKET